jgi:siroheme synthase
MRVLGQDAIDAKVMPGIILVGSSPTFYKIPVTKDLAQAVA